MKRIFQIQLVEWFSQSLSAFTEHTQWNTDSMGVEAINFLKFNLSVAFRPMFDTYRSLAQVMNRARNLHNRSDLRRDVGEVRRAKERRRLLVACAN